MVYAEMNSNIWIVLYAQVDPFLTFLTPVEEGASSSSVLFLLQILAFFRVHPTNRSVLQPPSIS